MDGKHLSDNRVLPTLGEPMTAKMLFATLLCIATITWVGCGRMDASQLNTYQGWGFEVQHPGTVTVTLKRPVEDFELYEFRSRTGLILRAYAGNHSTFGEGAAADATRSKDLVGGVEADRLEWRNSEARLHVEVLFRFKRSLEWPQELHFAFDGLMGEEKQIAERIIASTRASNARRR